AALRGGGGTPFSRRQPRGGGWGGGAGGGGAAAGGGGRPPPRPPGAPAAAPRAVLESTVRAELGRQIQALLKTRPDDLDAAANLAELGFDSISLAEFARVLSRFYAVDVRPSVFFSHPTLRQLAHYFVGEHRAAVEARHGDAATDASKAMDTAAAAAAADGTATARAPAGAQAAPADTARTPADEPIAVIGMSGRFPQARDVDELWRILADGVDTIDEIPSDRFDWRPLFAPDAPAEGKTNSKWCGCIPGVGEFDPMFFRILPSEAEQMDPRQRHLLQEAWRALEDAGLGPDHLARQKLGMFVGVEEGCDYQRRVPGASLTASHNGILASRLAYFLDMKGPVMAVNTACSSSLVAVHLASESVRRGECDVALAAGVNLLVSPLAYAGMTQAGMLSPDGACRAFDCGANGMVPGEAVAVVALKTLSRALADGDPVHAVIRGSDVNYDGRTNGITAPSGASQVELIAQAQRRAGVRPDDVDYVVAHGTGTRLGDSVEVNALVDAFRRGTDRQAFCALTSTKSNLGHTFAASGLVSLISLVLAMRHDTIPPTLHCDEPNDFIHWDASPFFVNRRPRAWPRCAGRARIGAVSAFGMSGTNAHVIVAEPPVRAPARAAAAPRRLLALSGRSEAALRARLAQLAAYLAREPAAPLDAVAATLLLGRHHFAQRAAFVVHDRDDALAQLHRALAEPAAFDAARGRAEPGATDAALDEPLSPDALADACRAYRAGRDDVGWAGLFEAPVARVSLPGYPFTRDTYWLDEPAAAPAASPHPLVHREVGTGGRTVFAGLFAADDPILLPARHDDGRYLSGLGYLEMARHAAERTGGAGVAALSELVWDAPLEARDGEPIALSATLHGGVEATFYAIDAPTRAGAPLHAGAIARGPAALPPRCDHAALRAALPPLAAGEEAALRRALATACGPHGAVFETLRGDASAWLATLALPDGVAAGRAVLPFEPAYLEAAWQLVRGAHDDARPISLRRIDTSGPLPRRLALHAVRRAAGYDLTFYDDDGHARLHLHELGIAPFSTRLNI
ncbi:MAG: beta-ketoacyl synthase N-terminal-like domain-containing protein, partial [Burkholderia sp.]